MMKAKAKEKEKQKEPPHPSSDPKNSKEKEKLASSTTTTTTTTTTPAANKKEEEKTKGKEQTLPSADRLLRIHILDATLAKEFDPYAVVSVGKHSAKTKQLKNTKNPDFDEHFVIEHEERDNESHLEVCIYDKGKVLDELLGKWRIQLLEIDQPQQHQENPEKTETKKKEKKKEKEQESWYTEDPLTVKLIDGKKETGELKVRVRREIKLVGVLTVKVKEVTLNKIEPNAEIHLLLKHLPTVHQSEKNSKGKKGKYSFNQSFVFEIDHSNNIKDLFIEVWHGSEKKIGELRMTLFDASKKVKGGEHLISNKEIVGEVKLEANLKPKK